jgi:hypothetical protein
MRLVRIAAVIGAMVAGVLGFSGSATASPLAAGAMPAAKAENALVAKAFHWGEPHYGPRAYGRAYRSDRGYYARPAYRPAYNPYRPAYYPRRRVYDPYRPVYVAPRPIYRGYRPAPRVVCRTRFRTVPTAYGLVRRPVEVCRRRW